MEGPDVRRLTSPVQSFEVETESDSAKPKKIAIRKTNQEMSREEAKAFIDSLISKV